MARTGRVKLDGEAYYHVIDRIAHKAFLLERPDVKGALLGCLQRAADFSGVDIGSYVLMDNHIHLCIHVPQGSKIADGELLRRIGVLYGTVRSDTLDARWRALEASGEEVVAEREKESYRRRMGDLSEFMKTFKQRFSQWYNATFRHEGTLWSGRFKSVMVESGEHMRVVVNYIHGNPVRAGMAARVADYGWSALGAAHRGDPLAVRGLSLLGIDIYADVDAMKRDRRLSNGKIIGSVRFVAQMKARLGMAAAGSPRRQNSFSFCGHSMTASHGHRSAPRHAA